MDDRFGYTTADEIEIRIPGKESNLWDWCEKCYEDTSDCVCKPSTKKRKEKKDRRESFTESEINEILEGVE
jgi:hypothetical protein